MTTNCCVYSSWLFSINAAVAFGMEEYVYGGLFSCLLTSSLLFHSHSTIYTNVIDKCCIAAVVLYGGHLLYLKCREVKYTIQILILVGSILTFLSTIYLFCVGYLLRMFCFCEDSERANQWHSYLHLLSSIGHCLILLI